MYCDYYGFSEKPFTITPNPRFIFLSKNHKEVFAHLLYGIRSHCGFIEITGEIGTGKTTSLRTLLNQLDSDSYRLAFIFNPSLSAQELLRGINREFGIAAGGATTDELLTVLNAFLLRENAAGRTVVLVIDEAQNLEAGVLEQIRLLSNLETENDKLIQIILVGQPELGSLLEQRSLRQLSQRITVRYHLRPMDFEDTREYIKHRLAVAGCRHPDLFSAAAVKKVFRQSRGYPRVINVLCDRALLVGYTDNSRQITPAMVATAIAELRRQARARGSWFRRWPGLATAVAVLAGVGAYLARLPLPLVEPVDAPVAAETARFSVESPAAAATRASDKTAELGSELARLPAAECAAAACSSLLGIWGAGATIEPGRALPAARGLEREARKHNLEVLPFSGSLENLLQLDAPALLELAVADADAPRYLALTAIEGDVARIAPAVGGRSELPLEDLGPLWTGQAYLLWKNFAGIPYIKAAGARGKEVRQLQRLLQEAGFLDETTGGRYDLATIAAVTRLQAAGGVTQDGLVGPQTLMLLYQYSGRFEQPKLTQKKPGEES